MKSTNPSEATQPNTTIKDFLKNIIKRKLDSHEYVIQHVTIAGVSRIVKLCRGYDGEYLFYNHDLHPDGDIVVIDHQSFQQFDEFFEYLCKHLD